MHILCFISPSGAPVVEQLLPDGWTYSIVSREQLGDGYLQAAVEQAPNADFFLVGLEWIGDELIAPATRLKLIQRLGIGYDNVDLAAARAHGVPVANIPDVNSITVAEHAIMLMIALLKRFREADRSMRAGEWKLTELMLKGTFELAGKTVGIVGLGRIGKALARRLAPFEVTTLYTDILDFPAGLEAELKVRRASFEELLGGSDIVTLHVPLTELTRNMMNRSTFALMKPTAYFLNTSRGEVVDESALVEVLESNAIVAAAIDVYKDEPPDPASPLLALDNLLLTPHIAGFTREVSGRFAVSSFANMRRVASGEPPVHVVDE